MDQPSISSSVDDYKAKALTQTLVSDLKRLRDLSQKLEFDSLVEQTNDILSTQERGGIPLQTSVNHVITTATELIKATESPTSALEKKQSELMKLSETTRLKITKIIDITIANQEMLSTFNGRLKTELKQAAARVIESTPVIESEFEKDPKAFRSHLANKVWEAVRNVSQPMAEEIQKKVQQGIITRWGQLRELVDELFGELTQHISPPDVTPQVETLHKQVTNIVQSVNQAYDVFNSPSKTPLSLSIKIEDDFRYIPTPLGIIGLFKAIFAFLGILSAIFIGGTLLGYLFSFVLGKMALIFAMLVSLLGGTYAAWKFVVSEIICGKKIIPGRISADRFQKRYSRQIKAKIDKQLKSSSNITKTLQSFIFKAVEPLEQLTIQVRQKIGSLLDTLEEIQIETTDQLQTLSQTLAEAQNILSRVRKLSEQLEPIMEK